MSNKPAKKKGLIELWWLGELPDPDADQNPETRSATAGTRRQCPRCKEWCAHGFCGRCEYVLETPDQAMTTLDAKKRLLARVDRE